MPVLSTGAAAQTGTKPDMSRALPNLPEPGTRVTLMFRGNPRHGTVQPYDLQWSHGAFPVRFDDGQWRSLSSREVIRELAQNL